LKVDAILIRLGIEGGEFYSERYTSHTNKRRGVTKKRDYATNSVKKIAPSGTTESHEHLNPMTHRNFAKPSPRIAQFGGPVIASSNAACEPVRATLLNAPR